MMTREELYVLAVKVKDNVNNNILETVFDDEPVNIHHYIGPVLAKERPKTTRTGKLYTPPRTRKYEEGIAKWGSEEQQMVPVVYPISVMLDIYDKTPIKFWSAMSAYGLFHHNKKDLDNMAKAVMDGLNGVLYVDDKQVVELYVKRHYAENEGFMLRVRRGGLTASEAHNFRAIYNGL